MNVVPSTPQVSEDIRMSANLTALEYNLNYSKHPNLQYIDSVQISALSAKQPTSAVLPVVKEIMSDASTAVHAIVRQKKLAYISNSPNEFTNVSERIDVVLVIATKVNGSLPLRDINNALSVHASASYKFVACEKGNHAVSIADATQIYDVDRYGYLEATAAAVAHARKGVLVFYFGDVIERSPKNYPVHELAYTNSYGQPEFCNLNYMGILLANLSRKSMNQVSHLMCGRRRVATGMAPVSKTCSEPLLCLHVFSFANSYTTMRNSIANYTLCECKKMLDEDSDTFKLPFNVGFLLPERMREGFTRASDAVMTLFLQPLWKLITENRQHLAYIFACVVVSMVFSSSIKSIMHMFAVSVFYTICCSAFVILVKQHPQVAVAVMTVLSVLIMGFLPQMFEITHELRSMRESQLLAMGMNRNLLETTIHMDNSVLDQVLRGDKSRVYMTLIGADGVDSIEYKPLVKTETCSFGDGSDYKLVRKVKQGAGVHLGTCDFQSFVQYCDKNKLLHGKINSVYMGKFVYNATHQFQSIKKSVTLQKQAKNVQKRFQEFEKRISLNAPFIVCFVHYVDKIMSVFARIFG